MTSLCLNNTWNNGINAFLTHFSHIPPVPGTVQANATTVDNQSVLSTPSAALAAPATQPGTVLCSMMSNANSRASPSLPASSSTSAAPTNDSITINGVMYTRHVNATHVYCLHETDAQLHPTGALVDGGANGSLAGTDMRILESEIHATTDVHGIANTFESLPFVHAAAKINTHDDGPIIGIFSHYAQRPDDGPTIHLKGQMESFGLLIDDKSHVIGGTQCIVTNEGYVMPLHIRNGLPYMSMSQPTDADMASFPHVFFCSDSPWDPSYLDGEFDATESRLPAEALACRESNDPHLNDYGGIVCHTTVIDRLVETCSYYACSAFTIAATLLSAFPQTIVHKLPDLNSLRPHFGWVPTDRIKATLDATTQYYHATVHYPYRKHFKSRFPATNVNHNRMKGLMSDNAKSKVSRAVKNLQRLYMIKDRQSEPHYQHQNPIECHIQDVKRMSNNIMDRVGCPAKFWLLCTLFTISLLNHLVNVNGVIPMSLITSQDTDILPSSHFTSRKKSFLQNLTPPSALDAGLGLLPSTGMPLCTMCSPMTLSKLLSALTSTMPKTCYFLTSVPACLPLLALRCWMEGRFHPGQSSFPCQMPLMSIRPTSNCQNSHLVSSLDYHSSMILIMDSVSEQR